MTDPHGEQWQQGPGVVSSVIRHWIIVGVATALGCAAAYGLAVTRMPLYEATAELVVTPRGAFDARPSAHRADPVREARTRAERITALQTLQAAAERLGGAVPVDELRELVTVEALDDSDLVLVTARASTPQLSAAMANAVAAGYRDRTVAEQRDRAQAQLAALAPLVERTELRVARLDARVAAGGRSVAVSEREATLGQLIAYQREVERLEALVDSGRADVDLVEPAQPPTDPIQVAGAIVAVLGAALGAAVGVMIAYRRAVHAPRAREPADPSVTLDAPLLGSVPRARAHDERGAAARGDVVAETCRFVMVALRQALDGHGGGIVVVMAARPGEGATFVCRNVALAAGTPTAAATVVDADLRRAGLTRRWGFEGTAGLAELVAGTASCADVSRLVRGDGARRVGLVPAGVGGTATEVLRASQLPEALRSVAEGSDVVLVDVPPALQYADASIVAAHADGILAVVARGTSMDDVAALRRQAAMVGTPILGYVFNRARRSSQGRRVVAAARAAPARERV